MMNMKWQKIDARTQEQSAQQASKQTTKASSDMETRQAAKSEFHFYRCLNVFVLTFEKETQSFFTVMHKCINSQLWLQLLQIYIDFHSVVR